MPFVERDRGSQINQELIPFAIIGEQFDIDKATRRHHKADDTDDLTSQFLNRTLKANDIDDL